MYKSVYDTDSDNIVDNAEKVNSALSSGWGITTLSFDGSLAKSIIVDSTKVSTPYDLTSYQPLITNGLGISKNASTLSLGNSSMALGDPNEDRILFWDNSKNTTGGVEWLEPWTGLTISGTSLITNDGQINHNNLLNYQAAKHFYQKNIDTVKTSLTGLLKATSGVLSTISDNSSNWNTAYGWGNHAMAGYLTAESDPQVGSNTLNYLSKWNGSSLVASEVYDNGNYVGVSDSLKINTSLGDARLTLNGNIALVGTSPTITGHYAAGNPSQSIYIHPASGDPTGNLYLGITSQGNNRGAIKLGTIAEDNTSDSILVLSSSKSVNWVSKSSLLGSEGYWELDGTDLYPPTSYDLGVGTDSPTTKLSVVGSANVTNNFTVGGTLYAGTIKENTGTGYLKLYEDGGKGITITTAAGYTGVNNDYPSQELDVTGDLNISDTTFMNVQRTSGDAFIDGKLGINHDPETYNLYIDGTAYVSGEISSNGTANIPNLALVNAVNSTICYGSNSTDQDLRFYNDYDNITTLFIQDDGKIGINDDTPGTTLDINGELTVSGVSDFNSAANIALNVLSSQSGNVTATDNYTCWIIQPTANIDFSLAAAVEETGRLITVINNNSVEGDFNITIKNSGGTIVFTLNAMDGFSTKSVTLIYSGTTWFVYSLGYK